MKFQVTFMRRWWVAVGNEFIVVEADNKDHAAVVVSKQYSVGGKGADIRKVVVVDGK
jgi:hypothetical protein